MHGRVPADLAGGVTTGPDVIYGADVAAVEAEAGAGLEHVAVSGIGG